MHGYAPTMKAAAAAAYCQLQAALGKVQLRRIAQLWTAALVSCFQLTWPTPGSSYGEPPPVEGSPLLCVVCTRS